MNPAVRASGHCGNFSPSSGYITLRFRILIFLVSGQLIHTEIVCHCIGGSLGADP